VWAHVEQKPQREKAALTFPPWPFWVLALPLAFLPLMFVRFMLPPYTTDGLSASQQCM
jgi:hypothetical protein